MFPKSVCRLYQLWQDGKIDEAIKLQGLVAQAEKACKEGIAATKFGAGHFAGPRAGLENPELFYPRKPYKPLGKDMQTWVIDVMKHLVEVESSIPDLHSGKGSSQTNGYGKH